jgi:hypothetical protein
MSDPKDWEEIVDDARKLDMYNLQREQTDLLRGMSSGSKPSSVQDIWDRRLGMTRAQDPVEYARRMKEWQKKDFKKWMKVLYIFFGIFALFFLAMFIKLSIAP